MPYNMDYAHTMSLCELPNVIILQHTGYKQHLRIRRYNDHVKQLRHPSAQEHWILKDWLELNIYNYKNSQYHCIIYVSLLSINRLDIMTFS